MVFLKSNESEVIGMQLKKQTGYAKLKAFFVEHGIRQQDVAEDLGLDRSTFNSKLNRNNADFTLAEVRYLCTTYNLDANKFFFGLKVPK